MITGWIAPLRMSDSAVSSACHSWPSDARCLSGQRRREESRRSTHECVRHDPGCEVIFALALRAALTVALTIASAYAQDARAIVRRSVQVDSRNDRLARNYTYKVLNETRNLDSAGR